jgi:Tol biopolymer transport system component
MKAGRTFLVSVNREGRASGNRSGLTSGGFFDFDAVLSEDGRFVAFASYDNNLVDNDTVCFGRCDGANGLEDVFVRDLTENKTELISVNRNGASGGSELSHAPAISADGRIVASEASPRIWSTTTVPRKQTFTSATEARA